MSEGTDSVSVKIGMSEALYPMSYISSGMLGVLILLSGALSQDGLLIFTASAVGASIFFLVAIGGFLRLRWALMAACFLALVVTCLSVGSWIYYGIRPLMFHLIVPPIVLVFNFLGICTVSRRKKF